MKLACDKCLKIFGAEGKETHLKVSTDHQVFYLCKNCQNGFWQSVDYNQPPIRKDGKEDDSQANDTLKKHLD